MTNSDLKARLARYRQIKLSVIGIAIFVVAPLAQTVRALAFKWIRIVFRCWEDRVAYDENKYLAALARRGSPLTSVVLAATATTV
jgi:hypothetical protein